VLGPLFARDDVTVGLEQHQGDFPLRGHLPHRRPVYLATM
jgi:hypothetical protein